MQFDEVCEIIGIDKQRQLWYLPYLLKYKYTPTEMVCGVSKETGIIRVSAN